MNTRYFHPAYRPFPAKVTNIFTQMGLKLQTSITLLYPPAPKLLNPAKVMYKIKKLVTEV
jgi:hypothetical protein